MFVYIVTFEQRAGLVKIGCSKNPNVRFRGLEAHHGKVEPSASWATDFNHYDVENWLHNFYFDKRVLYGRGIDTLIEFSGFKKTTVHAALNYLKCENIVERLDRHVMKINVERLIVL